MQTRVHPRLGRPAKPGEMAFLSGADVDGQPRVVMDTFAPTTLMTPADAKKLAMHLIDCAEAMEAKGSRIIRVS